jgi:hypothetical protein
MTSAFLWLVLALGAGRLPADPASLMPGGTTVFLETSDLGALAAALRDAPVIDHLQVPSPERLRQVLVALGGARVRTAAVGMDPSAFGVRRWVFVAEAEDEAAMAAIVETWTGVRAPHFAIGRFVVFADGDAKLDEVRELQGRGSGSLAEQEGFREFRSAVGAAAPIRFYCDVKEMWPRAFRAQIRNPSNLGWVLLGGHVTHVLRTVGTVFGTMSLGAGLEANLSAEIRPTDAKAFTEVNPAQEIVERPAGFAARLSVSRSLGRFWARRTAILDDAAQSTLDQLAGAITSAVPGSAMETLLAQFGEAFDLYVAECPPADAPSIPSLALVAVTTDQGPRCHLLEEYRKLLGALTSRVTECVAFRDESVCHRGVTLHVSRPQSSCEGRVETLPAGYAPTFAVVKDRMILGNRPSAVAALVDQVLDGRLGPRTAGDELELVGRGAARLLKEASALVRTDPAPASRPVFRPASRPDSRPPMVLPSLEAVLNRVGSARIAFDVAGKQASLRMSIVAPDLFTSDGTSTRPR